MTGQASFPELGPILPWSLCFSVHYSFQTSFTFPHPHPFVVLQLQFLLLFIANAAFTDGD